MPAGGSPRGGSPDAAERKGRAMLDIEQSMQTKLVRRITKQKTLRMSMGKKGNAVEDMSTAMTDGIEKARALDAKIARAEYELKQRGQLLSMFQMFDDDGGGTITLSEMFRTFERELGLKDPEAKAGILRHFTYMDRDGNGQIDFREFERATLGTGNEKFETLNDEKDAFDHGHGLFLMLAQLKRSRIIKNARKLAKMGATVESFKAMMELASVDMFALDMEHAQDGATHDGKETGVAAAKRTAKAKIGARAQAEAEVAALGKQQPHLQLRLPKDGFEAASSKGARAMSRMRQMQREQAALSKKFGKYASFTRLPSIIRPPLLLPAMRDVRVLDATSLRRRRRTQIAKLGGSNATSMMF